MTQFTDEVKYWIITLRIFFLFIFSFALFTTQVATAQSQRQLNFQMLEAAKNDLTDSVKYWLDKGANVNFLDQYELSALHHAIYNREYLKRCAQKEIKSDDPNLWLIAMLTPNYYKGGLETCNVLIQNGIDVNSNKSSRKTPLMLACSKGDLRVCKLLLDNGASISMLDEEGNDAISYAQGKGYKRVTSFLIDQQTYSEQPTYYEFLLKMDSSILKNNFSQAREFGELALITANSELKVDHSDIEMIKRRLVVINEQLRKFDNAHNIQKGITKGDLSETKEKVSGMLQYPGYYDMLSNMATFAMNDGDYLKAEIIINGIIEYSNKYEINKSGDFTFDFWLSHIYFVLEEFDKSEKILNELLKENIEIEHYKKELYTAILLELSQINFAIGNIKASKQYAEKALNEMNSDENENRFVALSLIGQSYLIEANFKMALEYFKESLMIAQTFKNAHFLNYAGTKNNLGYYYLKNNELHNAEIIFEELKSEYEEKKLYTQNYCICLENLAIISIKQNDLIRAKYYADTAQKIKNEQNSSRLSDLSLLASIHYGLNNYREADSLYQLSGTWIVKSLSEKFLYLSENDRTLFAKTKNRSIDEFQSFSLNYYPMNLSIAQFLYNNELFRKGMLLNTSQNIRIAINNSSDTTLVDTWTKLKEIRNRINFLESQPKEKLLDISDLEEKANQLDKTLTQKSQTYRHVKSEQQFRWQDVQNKLKEGEAAIEFSSFQYYKKEWTDSIVYCALVLKKSMKHPLLIPLFEQKQLDSLFVGGTAEPNYLYASRGVETTYNPVIPNGKKLYDLIWKPLEENLADIKTVYYSPSGSLYQIAFAALPIDTTSYLCDKYNLVQLSSTRQLATSDWQSTPDQISNATLFGGIKYDLEPQEVAELQGSIPQSTEGNISRGFFSDSTLSRGSINFLKGTKIEVDSISTELKSKNINTTLFTGIGANEETFKSLTNQNIDVLHIATHGFFFPDIKEKPEEMNRFMLTGEQRFRNTPNPLLRSGLFLAGGNHAWKGEEPICGLEDGILTAQEISEMYLPNTQLVVLSACETGLGDIQGGEGVFGLQRAFKLAGAKSILMSLWKVDDDATRELMQSFYKKWLGGMDKRDAFRTAQKELRNKYPKEPNKWAGFVMVD